MQGRPPLEGMEEPPDIDRDLIPIWTCWHQLNGSRAVGMAASGIPWSEVSAWCVDHGVIGDAKRRWCRLVLAMDAVALAWWHRPKGGADADPGTAT